MTKCEFGNVFVLEGMTRSLSQVESVKERVNLGFPLKNNRELDLKESRLWTNFKEFVGFFSVVGRNVSLPGREGKERDGMGWDGMGQDWIGLD